MKNYNFRYRLQIAAILCVLLISIFFTGCSPLKKLNVLVNMEPDQELYFKNTILQNYEKKTAVKVNVFDYRNPDSLEYYMKKYSGRLNLVELPYEKCGALAARGYFKPLDSFLTFEEMRFFNDNFLLGSFGMVSARPTLVPRSFETPVLVYSKSKVAAAVKIWPEKKELIADVLKKYNGFGLPSGYILESDPNYWDFYDIAVIGLIWTRSEAGGITNPRVAHTARKNGELSDFIQGGIYQCNGDSSSVGSCSGDPVTDFLHWEALYVSCGVYNSKMWNAGWGRSELMEKFANGEIYLAPLTIRECFRLHGTGHAERKGLMKNPDDCGVALLPQACSVNLSAAGNPLRGGRRSVMTASTWWAIPFDASSALLSYRLVKFISDTVQHAAECAQFGMVPVRKEVVTQLPRRFADPWIRSSIETGLGQVIQNGNITKNDNSQRINISSLYIDLWFNLIVGRNWAVAGDAIPDRTYMEKTIRDRYTTKAAGFVGISGQKY